MPAEAWLLITAGLAFGLWSWATHARDRVDLVSREVCRELALQRLDDTVTFERLRVHRDGNGRFACERLFAFEFTVNGADRHLGRVCLRGDRPLWAHLEHPDGAIHIDLLRG